MNYAAPGGGILSMELLRPTFAGPHHPWDPSLTRSSIIQQLVLLVGFLDWIGPDAANAELCASCRIVIQRVLDHTFSHSGIITTGHDETYPPRQEEAMANIAIPGQVNGEDAFFGFDLLDTFSWLKDDDLGIWGLQDHGVT
jgi:hypothetical protein